ncbi:MAG: hypothetical protein CVT63_01495 [Candidatus Anoxymicrobium japonicum]|uniref:Uncharacterized protein n=1 Tax=Candidatus Anoxymicrobium japonicum TaxID=2013648 RepID=A0A2N3G7J8_9ACTN|nr:MAG: hypothetical protein CVT63_01495 [Candidatus Anoxymicrobium japonicum]
MLLAIILIYCLPVAFVLLIVFMIGAAGMKTYRTAKRTYADLKPCISDLSKKAASAQEKGLSFSDRGQKLAEAFEEIGGRWAFITQTISEATNSPVIKLARLATRFK